MRINIKDKKNFIDMFNTLYKNNNINNINGISIDSRNFQKDDIFIALNGEKYNGNEYIDSIYEKSICCFSQYKNNKRKVIFNKSSQGTIAKLASNWRLLTNSTILGITGSNGKTTTKDLIHHIISKKFKCSKSIGNHNSLIGLPLSFLNTKISDEFSILELGANKPNEIEKLCNIIKPKYSLITNISNAHIKNYKSINDIINTKAAIYHSTPTNGTAFINADCNHYNKMDLNCKIKTFGFKNDADYRGELFYDDAYNLNIRINNESIKVPSHLSHLPNLILSAYVICNHFKISSRIFKNALDDFKLPSGRGQILKYKKCNVIDDTYNSNPSSLKLGILDRPFLYCIQLNMVHFF